MLKTDPEVLKNKQLNNTITGMKNILEGVNSRINEAEKWISGKTERWK